MGLFDGLEGMGINLEKKVEIYDHAEKKETEKQKVKEKEIVETDYLFDKSFECPACDYKFKTKAVRTGRVQMLGTDYDLKPIYKQINSLKYDAIMCPMCGYSALSSHYGVLMPTQIKNIREKISSNFVCPPLSEGGLSYDDAIMRHKMALLSSVVKPGRNSEKAYTCLKLAWLHRDKRKEMEEKGELTEKAKEEMEAQENDFLKNAYEGFVAAYSKEEFPICNMDQYTMDYLMAQIAFELGKLKESAQHVTQILGSRTAPKRIKDKAVDLKEQIKKKATPKA